jgi:hypothetical protein
LATPSGGSAENSIRKTCTRQLINLAPICVALLV